MLNGNTGKQISKTKIYKLTQSFNGKMTLDFFLLGNKNNRNLHEFFCVMFSKIVFVWQILSHHASFPVFIQLKLLNSIHLWWNTANIQILCTNFSTRLNTFLSIFMIVIFFCCFFPSFFFCLWYTQFRSI